MRCRVRSRRRRTGSSGRSTRRGRGRSSASAPRKRNDDPRAMTNSQRRRDSSSDEVVRQRVGDRAMRAGNADKRERQDRDRRPPPAGLRRRPQLRAASALAAIDPGARLRRLHLGDETEAEPCTVRIRRCDRPSSPSAWRADLTRLATAESETIRPSQMRSMISSLLTTRSRFSISRRSSANTCGSTGSTDRPKRSSRLCQYPVRKSSKSVDHGPPI